jgi:phytoene synthase
LTAWCLHLRTGSNSQTSRRQRPVPPKVKKRAMRVQRNDNPAGVRVSDLRYCTALLNKGSKTFSLATRLLPKDVATALTVLYAFCRVADDAVDDAPSVDAAKAALLLLQQRVEHIYDPRVDVEHLVIDRALRAVVMHYDIPRAVLDGLLEGFLWDVEGRTYETIEEVHAYAARVAGTVGAMIAYVTRCPQLLARDATDQYRTRRR